MHDNVTTESTEASSTSSSPATVPVPTGREVRPAGDDEEERGADDTDVHPVLADDADVVVAPEEEAAAADDDEDVDEDDDEDDEEAPPDLVDIVVEGAALDDDEDRALAEPDDDEDEDDDDEDEDEDEEEEEEDDPAVQEAGAADDAADAGAAEDDDAAVQEAGAEASAGDDDERVVDESAADEESAADDGSAGDAREDVPAPEGEAAAPEGEAAAPEGEEAAPDGEEAAPAAQEDPVVEDRPRLPGVLIVDGDVVARRALGSKFSAAGYRVAEAYDSEAAFAAAVRMLPDVIVVDVSLPDVDGWGLLASLKADAQLAGAQTVLMSEQRAWLEELRAVNAGADLYASKNLQLVDAVENLVGRKKGMLANLHNGAWGPLSDVGAASVLLSACEQRARAVLSVDVVDTSVKVFFEDGVVVSAHAKTKDVLLSDEDALTALLEIEDAPFAFEPVAGPPVEQPPPPRTLGRSWRAVAPSVVERLNNKRARERSGWHAATALSVDAQKKDAWAKLASDDAVAVADALAAGRAPADLTAQFPALLVDAVVEDLGRRGILSLAR